jgi:long-chain fatty acid transport protein
MIFPFRILAMAAAVLGVLEASAIPAFAQYGIALSGAGPINRSMGGASTAPLDASGALYWNPATISGLGGSELEVGLELLQPQTRLSSSFGPFSGSNSSDSNIMPLPTMGLVYRPDNSPWTFGFGVFAAGGFAVNYAQSTTNPILFPQAAKGLGPLSAQLQVMQLVPTVSLQVTDRLSIGVSPTVSVANLQANPFFVATPNLTGYPTASQGKNTWGAGVQAGIYYRTDSCWHLGASIKSPQWFQNFEYNSTDSLGQPRTLNFQMDYPLIATAGVGYTGFERWTLAADFHFINYHNTPGFSQSGFDPTGAVRGLGWNNVFAIGAGAQYQCTDHLSLRAGYSYNTNPIDNANTMFNVASPMILQNTVYLGGSYNFTRLFTVSLAYAHAFENFIQGPFVSPLGTIPGTTVRSSVSADSLMLGATVKF